MLYYIGQMIGIIASILCVAMPLFRKKWKILVCSGVSALLFGLNLTLIGKFGSGVMISGVCIAQNLVALWHLKNETMVTKPENITFLILYICLGALGYKSMIDILPILASVFNMLAAFQPDMRKTRIFLLLNAIAFCIYYAIAGSTAVIAEIIAVGSTTMALIRKE